MKTQLLCTFTDKVSYKEVVELIKSNFQIAFNYIYVLQNKEIPNDLYITYNIVSEDITNKINLKTILVHRKKHSKQASRENEVEKLSVSLQEKEVVAMLVYSITKEAMLASRNPRKNLVSIDGASVLENASVMLSLTKSYSHVLHKKRRNCTNRI